MKRKIIGIVLGISLGLLLIVGGSFAALWKLSVTFQESFYEAALSSGLFPLQMLGADGLKDYPSKSSAIALVVYLNVVDKTTSQGDAAAEEALASLIILTGQTFGTNFEGTQYNYSWGPPEGEGWQDAVGQVNWWAIETFGIEALGALAFSSEDKKKVLEAPAQQESPQAAPVEETSNEK